MWNGFFCLLERRFRKVSIHTQWKMIDLFHKIKDRITPRIIVDMGEVLGEVSREVTKEVHVCVPIVNFGEGSLRVFISS